MYSNFDVFLINYTEGGGYNIVSTLHEHLHASGLEQLHGNVCVKHWCFIFWVLSIREGVNTNFRVSTLGICIMCKLMVFCVWL